MRRTPWIILFTALFLLSLDFWAWRDAPSTGPLGIPAWVYYFMILQFVLAAAIYGFGLRYWTERERLDDAAAGDRPR
jgi:hypothetical protein